MKAINAIYENGAFHPVMPVDLPERTTVEVLVPDGVKPSAAGEGIARTAGAWAGLPGAAALDAEVDAIRQSASYRE
ncbi:MAG: antitoxin family protein [Lacipirellulaceae bacterium]